MSFTYVREAAKKSEVQGSTRVSMGVVTADATSGVVQAASHGLNYIFGGSLTPKSAATGGFNVPSWNAATAGTALGGSVHITSCAIGDTFNVLLYGR
jgi:hypothetical protein